MTDDSLQKTAKTVAAAGAAPGRGRPFRKGESGNPKGRPRGSRNRKTQLAELLLDGEAERLTRKAVELALDGDPYALKLCLDRLIAPRRERTVEFELPPIRNIPDLDRAVSAVASAVAAGEVTPAEAAELANAVEALGRVLERTKNDRFELYSWEGPILPRPEKASEAPAGNITKS